jgi:hypothetical protein
MPRFVILHHVVAAHSGRSTHWDFMIETDNTLKTWSLDEEPGYDRVISAVRIADHRREYLDYEGPLSQDRGNVTRFDHGSYTLISEDDTGLLLEMRGSRLQGIVELKNNLFRCRPVSD